MRRPTTALVPVLLVCLFAGSPATAAASVAADTATAGIGIRLLEAPADRADDPRARSYVIDHVQPGQVIERNIEISNGTPHSARIELYAGAARIDGGQFLLGDRSEQNELTSWTTVTPGEAELSGGGRAEATLAITVPPDAPAGEYYGVVWAAMPAHGTPSAAGMAVTSRVGVRVYLSVGGTEPRTEFRVETLTAVRSEVGEPGIEVLVCNAGGRAVDLLSEVSLRNGPGGTAVGPVPANKPTALGVGQCGPVRIGLDEALPDGPWQAEVIVRSGTTERRASATVTFPPPGEAEPAPLDDEQSIPWTVLAVGAVAVLLGGAVAARLWSRWPSAAPPSLGHRGPAPIPVNQLSMRASSSSPGRLRPPPSHRSGDSSPIVNAGSSTTMRARREDG